MDGHALWHEADNIVGGIRTAIEAECTQRHSLAPLALAHEQIIALARKFAAEQGKDEQGS